MKLYAIFDKIAGHFERPFVSFNDGTASRDFECLKATPGYKEIMKDLDLYFLGEMNEETGLITGDKKLVTEGVAISE